MPKLREALIGKNLTLPQAFALFDPEKLGLISFSVFSKVLDQILNVSNSGKELLFSKMDRLRIGLVSYEQFKKVINSVDDIGLRMLNNEVQTEDSFDWEQNIIKAVLDWILDKRLSLSEAFKLMDVNFDGVITLQDLQQFLVETLQVEVNRIKTERLFRVMDVGKTGRIYLTDFENLFTKVFRA